MKPSELPQKYLDLIPKEKYEETIKLDNINQGFGWSSTIYGREFWSMVYNARTIDQLPPIPDIKVPEKDFVPFTLPSRHSDPSYNKWHYMKKGIKHHLSFYTAGISNCGLISIHGFYFPNRNPLKEEVKLFHELLRSSCGSYRNGIMSHNEEFVKWFEGLEKIHQFTNKNSGNEIGIYFVSRDQ